MTLAPTLSPADACRREWSTVVVGAGPAGATTAHELARLGVDVLLIDRASFPRPKVCGCCLNGASLAALSRVGMGDLPARLGAVRLDRVQLAVGGRIAGIPLKESVAVSRNAFDAALVRAAVSAGAQFLPHVTASRFENLSHVPSRRRMLAVTIREKTALERSIVCDSLVIAAGLNGRLGSGTPPQVAASSRIGAGCQIECDGPVYTSGSIWMAVGRGGYVGLVRLEDGQLDVAAAFDPAYVRASGGLGPAAEALLEGSGFPPVPGLETADWRGTPALTRSKQRVAGDGWFAVGDAAGYVEPFTGEGMAWAMTSAVALAPVVARGSGDAAREWERLYARLVRRRQFVCRASAAVLRSPRLCGIAVRLLAAVPLLARPVVAALNTPPRLPLRIGP